MNDIDSGGTMMISDSKGDMRLITTMLIMKPINVACFELIWLRKYSETHQATTLRYANT